MERFHNDLGVSEYGYGCVSAKPVPEPLIRVCVAARALRVSFLGRPVAPPMIRGTVSVFPDWAFPGMMGGDEC